MEAISDIILQGTQLDIRSRYGNGGTLFMKTLAYNSCSKMDIPIAAMVVSFYTFAA